MELVPFGQLRVMSTVTDEAYIAALLDETGKTKLTCLTCGSSSFTLDAIIKTKLDISFGSHDQKAIVREKKTREAMLLNVVECATCKGSDFNIEKKDDEEGDL